jgi:hypothetical protein
MRQIRAQLDDWANRLIANDDTADLGGIAAAIRDQIREIEDVLMIPDLKDGWPGMTNQGIQVTRRLAGLPAVVSCGDYRPTDQAYAVFEKLAAAIDEQLAQFTAVKTHELAAFNQELNDQAISMIGM